MAQIEGRPPPFTARLTTPGNAIVQPSGVPGRLAAVRTPPRASLTYEKMAFGDT